MRDGLGRAVTGHMDRILNPFAPGDVRDVALFRSDVQERTADCENVIYLARMNNTNELLAHHDYVQVGRRQYTTKLIKRLIRQADNIVQMVLSRKCPDFFLFAAATHEAKSNFLARRQLLRG